MTLPGNISTQTELMTPEVYGLLAQANLLRIRGSWQEAVDKCMEAMRLVPGNGAAQSLLGDIYENQGKIDEAIQWYRMALDTNPGSPADKQKLARLIAMRGQDLDDSYSPFPGGERGGGRGVDDAQVVVQPTLPPSTQPSSISGAWSPAPETKPAEPWNPLPSTVLAKSNALRATAMICGVLLFGIVLTAVVQSHGTADANSKNQKLHDRDDHNYSQPTTIGAAAFPARDPFEVGLYNALEQAGGLPADVRFADVIADPRDGRLTLTYIMRPTVNIDRETVLRDALAATESAATVPATESYPYMTIRMLLSDDDLVTSPDSGSWIFIGDIGRADIVDFPTDPSTVPGSQISPVFTNQWWTSSLAPTDSSSTTPSSTPPAAPSPSPAPQMSTPQSMPSTSQSAPPMSTTTGLSSSPVQ